MKAVLHTGSNYRHLNHRAYPVVKVSGRMVTLEVPNDSGQTIHADFTIDEVFEWEDATPSEISPVLESAILRFIDEYKANPEDVWDSKNNYSIAVECQRAWRGARSKVN